MKMKKIPAMLMVGALSVGLVACSEETEEVKGSVDKSKTEQTEQTDKKSDEKTDKDSSTTAVDQQIVDDENITASLAKIVHNKDDIWGESYEVKFDVKNNTGKDIIVQAEGISADGKMVDGTLTSMSTDISADKSATAVLTIDNYEGYEFPELNSDLELKLLVIDAETWETIKEYPVKVTF